MTTLDLEVFRAGDYGERGRWTEETLDTMARDYDAALHEAPVTVDHAASGPALGWVAGLRRVGSVLVARLRDLDPAFAELLRRGAYKKRSVELYPALRETGRPYLRAVSFLGACPPAVKGLADIVFAEGDGAPVRVAFDDADPRESAWLALRERLMAAGRWLPRWEEMGLRPFWDALAGDDHRAWFEAFLDSLPAVIPTEPLASPSPGPGPATAGVPRPSPRAELLPSSLALHRRAVAFREEHAGMSYADALRAVSARD